MEPTRIAQLTLSDEARTRAFGTCLAPLLQAGDVVLLVGEIGAGKSVLSRAIIQTRLAMSGRMEDVPSPTFTLVQTYDLDDATLWHCDLYRLTEPGEVEALGLDEAFATGITLIEWPDRLGDQVPPRALVVQLTSPETAPDSRHMTLTGIGPDWAERLTPCLEPAA